MGWQAEYGLRETWTVRPPRACVPAQDSNFRGLSRVREGREVSMQKKKKKTNKIYKIVRRRPAIGSRERCSDESGVSWLEGGIKISIFRWYNIMYVYVLYYSYLLLEIQFVTWWSKFYPSPGNRLSGRRLHTCIIGTHYYW